jgi:hypothetical protein
MSKLSTPSPSGPAVKQVPAGCMPPWEVGQLPEPPRIRWSPRALVGPGLMMAGAAIGGGEWLMGPSVTARYGGMIMWLATLSILFQVVYNLEVMRYTLYCGESIFIGFFRLLPGPRFWACFYIFIDFFAIWPYLSANAAVPLHAALLGHLPTADQKVYTQWLAYGVFLLAFVPLIFGGKVYTSLERLMVAKVVLVLGYLLFVGIFFVSWETWVEVFAGFVFLSQGTDGTWGFHLLPGAAIQPGWTVIGGVQLGLAGQSVTPALSLDWALLAAFAAIAGIGGLNNSQLSNYSRDKGWGMGSQVGAIPSIVGGKGIALAHTGQVFPLTEESFSRWKGWLKVIRRDQLVIWFFGCVLGMAIPSLVSLEFVRGMSVQGDQVAAATAVGIVTTTGVEIFWFLTLLCGFLVLAPSQVTTMDGIVRRWTDVLWTGNRWLQRLEGHQVKKVYYGLLGAYAVWGLFVLTFLPQPLVMVKVSGVLMNFALGFSAFHTLAVNLIFLPKPLRPGWVARFGLVGCGVFFIGISVLGFPQALRDLGIL